MIKHVCRVIIRFGNFIIQVYHRRKAFRASEISDILKDDIAVAMGGMLTNEVRRYSHWLLLGVEEVVVVIGSGLEVAVCWLGVGVESSWLESLCEDSSVSDREDKLLLITFVTIEPSSDLSNLA